jgi:hypothetical protein
MTPRAGRKALIGTSERFYATGGLSRPPVSLRGSARPSLPR